MEKCWYAILEGSTKGPFNIIELMDQPKFTPDTLVWKDGFATWRPAREVEELKEAFKDKNVPREDEESEWENPKLQGDEVLAAKVEPPFMLIWLVIVALILIYILSQFYVRS